MADEVRRFINGEIDDEGNQLPTVDEDGTKTALEGDLVQDVYDLSYQLKDAATTSEILVEISGRETLPNLALFDIYQ